MKFFPLIWRNVVRKKLRTFLTMGSIVLVLVLIVVLVSLLMAMYSDPSGGRGSTRLVVQHATGLASFLPLSQRPKIEQIPGVVAVTPQVWFGGVYKDDRPENFFGQLSCDPKVFFTIFDDAVIAPDVLAQFQQNRDSFVAGKVLEEKYGWKIGDRITIKGAIFPLDLNLVYAGPYTAGDQSNIFFHNEYLDQSNWFGAGRLTGIYYLKVDRPENLGAVSAAIDRMNENSDAPTKTMTEKQFQASFLEMMGNIKGMISIISLAILFALTLIVANTIAMSARERVTEIAVMKTIGFRNGQILGLVLSESILMSLLGGVVGVLLAAFVLVPGMVKGMASTPMAPFLLNFSVKPEVWIGAFVVSAGIGVLAGIAPAFNAARASIVDGLRRVV